MAGLTKRAFLKGLAVAGGVGLAGCSGSPGREPDGGDGGGGSVDGGADGGGSGGGAADGAADGGGADGAGGSGDRDPDAVDLPLADRRPQVAYDFAALRDEVRSGGVPKDGIPAIDDPKFVGADAVEGLDSGSVVFGFAGEEDVVAYPQRILVQHEIVNDTLDGRPVSVTYCPLTGTVLGFERGETTFVVSGDLLNNNLVMYDRATDSRWPQVLATAIAGPFEGEALREFRLVWTTWEEWREVHPETVVLSTETGYARNYGNDPYGGYDPPTGYYASGRTLFPALGDDDRYQEKEVVIGARTPDGAVAFVKSALADAGAREASLGGDPVTAVYDRRLDTAYVYRTPGVTSIEVDSARVTVDGEDYAPDAAPLERIHAFDAMWFAWSGFYPDTEVVA